jgi:hypothetical protein
VAFSAMMTWSGSRLLLSVRRYKHRGVGLGLLSGDDYREREARIADCGYSRKELSKREVWRGVQPILRG